MSYFQGVRARDPHRRVGLASPRRNPRHGRRRAPRRATERNAPKRRPVSLVAGTAHPGPRRAESPPKKKKKSLPIITCHGACTDRMRGRHAKFRALRAVWMDEGRLAGCPPDHTPKLNSAYHVRRLRTLGVVGEKATASGRLFSSAQTHTWSSPLGH